MRREFAQVYLRHRGHERPDRHGLRVQERRPAAYRDALAAFLEDVLGVAVTTLGDGDILIPTAGRETLRDWPAVFEDLSAPADTVAAELRPDDG